MSNTFQAQHKFDPAAMRHYLNGELSVLHCHHYTALFTQLANDAKLLKGAQQMTEAAAETMFPPLQKYFKDNQIIDKKIRAEAASAYFAYIGLGKVQIDLEAGKAIMTHSHIDEGWKKKWGNAAKSINFIGQGFLMAAAAAIENSTPSAYNVDETESIACGKNASKFTITKK